jgi:cyanamide hydratase
MAKQNIEEFGWTAVPRNRSNVPSAIDDKTTAITVNFHEIWPKTPVVQKAQEYAKTELPKETYNHSLRVYCYGTFPSLHHHPTHSRTPQATQSSPNTSPPGSPPPAPFSKPGR